MLSYPDIDEAVTVILIDDDRDHLDLMSMVLGGLRVDGRPLNVVPFQNAGRAFAHLPRGRELVILCDYEMPGGDGLEWLPDLVSCNAGPVLMMTARGDERVASEAFRRGAADYLVKSEITRSPESLTRSISESLRRWKLESYSRELARSLRQSNEELAARNDQLRRLTDTAHRFVDDVAHEFRTPLAVIREFSSLVRDGIGGEVNDRQAEFLDFVLDSTGDLARLVDDFLDSSRIRAGTLPIDRRGVAVDEIVERVERMLASRSAVRQITLQVDVEPNLPAVHVDVEKFVRVLANFGVNAIKYSPTGSNVTLRVTAEDDDDDDGVRFAVVDEGPGISLADRERLFQRFTRRDDHGSIEGVGLGLSIAAEMARLNLAPLDIQSEIGEGSTFAAIAPRDNPESIIRAWIRVNGADDTTVEDKPTVGIVRVGVTGGRHRETDANIAEVINGLGHPGQLVLGAPDRGALLLGRNLDPSPTADRLAEAWSEHAHQQQANDGSLLPSLSIVPLSSHSIDDPSLIRIVLTLLHVPAATAAAFAANRDTTPPVNGLRLSNGEVPIATSSPVESLSG